MSDARKDKKEKSSKRRESFATRKKSPSPDRSGEQKIIDDIIILCGDISLSIAYSAQEKISQEEFQTLRESQNLRHIRHYETWDALNEINRDLTEYTRKLLDSKNLNAVELYKELQDLKKIEILVKKCINELGNANELIAEIKRINIANNRETSKQRRQKVAETTSPGLGGFGIMQIGINTSNTSILRKALSSDTIKLPASRSHSRLFDNKQTNPVDIAIDYIKKSRISEKHKKELLDRVCSPCLIDQEGNNLCGPATFVMHLAQEDPLRYATMVVELITNKKFVVINSDNHKSLQLDNNYEKTQLSSRSVDDVVLSALRRASNSIHLYRSARRAGPFETLMGYTKPKDFILWHKVFYGDCNMKDTTRIYNKDGKAPSPIVQNLFDVHCTTDPALDDLDANLDMAIQDIKNRYSLSMLVTAGLANQIVKYDPNKQPSENTYDPSDDAYAPIVDVEFSHFIKVNKLGTMIDDIDKKKYVTIEIDTWGNNFSAKIPYDDFIRGYRGCISAKIEKLNPELEDNTSPSPPGPS